MNDYTHIVRVCEQYLERHGDNYLGVGWTRSQSDVDARYAVMLGVIDEEPGTRVQLLDFGCGASHLLEHIRRTGNTFIEYSGLDLSDRFLELSRQKFPDIAYYRIDVHQSPGRLPHFDYIVMNGLFTARFGVAWDAFWEHMRAVLRVAFSHARKGIAFNVMSKHVDWERADLFHLPMDMLGSFVVDELSRHFVIRHDYGLYEYTCYVYHSPRRRS